MVTIGKEIERLRRQYKDNLDEHVAVMVWSEDDMLCRAGERKIKITREQAQDIIDRIDRKQDATLGITWDTIDCYLDDYEEETDED